MHVISYLAGIPSKNKNPEKPDVLKRFIQGVIAQGDRGLVSTDPVVQDCDVAVIQGWQHEHGKSAPHLKLRQDVVDHQARTGKHTIIVDSNLFNYADQIRPPAVKYSRFSMDGVFPITGNYFWDHSVDPKRWQQISRDLDITLKPWKTNGRHILICTQRNGGWSMKGLTVSAWLDQVIADIRRYSDRPIVVRGHPGDKRAAEYLSHNKNYKLSTGHTILDDFNKAWAVVTYNSSPGVAAAIEGIPVFVTDPVPEYSQAFAVANVNIADIESPKMWERQQWIERLSMCHWNRDELSNGLAWQHFKKFIV